MLLSQKENELLKELKEQERISVSKYRHYAGQSADGQLKSLFSQIAQRETQHLQTLEQMSAGQIPAAGGGASAPSTPAFTAYYTQTNNNEAKQNDSYLCGDALLSEKHASHLYDTASLSSKSKGCGTP